MKGLMPKVIQVWQHALFASYASPFQVSPEMARHPASKCLCPLISRCECNGQTPVSPDFESGHFVPPGMAGKFHVRDTSQLLLRLATHEIFFKNSKIRGSAKPCEALGCESIEDFVHVSGNAALNDLFFRCSCV